MHFLLILELFFLGMVAGMAVGLPYGPVGFILIRRFYLFGMKSGMYSAFGMACSDTFYAVIVGFGLHSVLHFVTAIAIYAEIVLGFLLIFLGYRSMKQKLELQIDEEKKHPARDITSTFFINILNPSLVVWFALAFSILGNIVKHSVGRVGSGLFIAGIACGACFLWFIIGGGIRYLRKKNRDELVQKINYVTGGVLALLGVAILILAVIKFF
jgi:threonine/homoserine/homoserine lactone efflux protein